MTDWSISWLDGWFIFFSATDSETFVQITINNSHLNHKLLLPLIRQHISSVSIAP